MSLVASSAYAHPGVSNALSRAREIVRVSSKTDGNRSTREECARERAIPLVTDLVAEHEAAGRGRMEAYRRVGRAIGRSATWVRQLLAGIGVGLSKGTWDAIVDATASMTDRMNARAAAKTASSARLMEEAHAIRAGAVRRDPGDRPVARREGFPGLDEVAP